MNTKKTSINVGFTTIELLSSIAILSVLIVILMGALSSVTTAYVNSDRKIQALEGGRAALELLTRELTPAVVDTRMQFIVLPGEALLEQFEVPVASNSPALLWMAPLGRGGDLRCVGYFLTSISETKKFRLKRIYIRNDNPFGYFPRLINEDDARDLTMRTDPLSAKWFYENWDKEALDDRSSVSDKTIVSTVLDRVVAMWIQPLDLRGNPIPWIQNSKIHPKADIIYNSAGYFHMAEGADFDDGSTFTYLAESPLVMKAHRIPPEVEIALVVVSEETLNREVKIPEMENLYQKNGALDLRGSLDEYLTKLRKVGINDSEAFSIRVKLTNGG